MQETLESKTNRPGKKVWLILVALFILSTFFRSVVAINSAEYTTFLDELLHVQIAKSIANGGGISFRGTNLEYLSCLYSVAIAPVFALFHNQDTAHNAVLVLNSIMMSSAVFPIYLTAVKFIKGKGVWLAVLYGTLIAEMMSTMKVMQENLYYPLVMWFFFAFSHVILEERDRPLPLCLVGTLLFLLSICKDMGQSIVLAVGVYLLVELFLRRDNRTSVIKDAVLVFLTYFVLHFTYSWAFAYFNPVPADVGSNVIIQEVKNVLNLRAMLNLVYPALFYAFFTLIATGVFPIPVLIGNISSLNVKEKRFLLFLVSYTVITIGAICVLIVPGEDPGNIVIRFHSRYYFYAFIGIVMLFVALCEKAEKSLRSWESVCILGALAVLVSFMPIAPRGGDTVDSMSLAWMKYVLGEDMLAMMMRCLIVICIAVGIWFIGKYPSYVCVVLTALILMVHSVGSFGILLHIYTGSKASQLPVKNDALAINDYLDKYDYTDEDSLILSSAVASAALFECYFASPYHYAYYSAFPVGKPISFQNLQYISSTGYAGWYDENTKTPQFIITDLPMPLSGYEEVELGLSYYHLMERTEGDIFLKYSESGVFGDRWVGADPAVLEVAGPEGETAATLELTVDNWLFGTDLEVTYTDAAGGTGTIIIPSTAEQMIVSLPITKLPESTAYSITLTPAQTVQPGTEDTRYLAFRLFDWKVIESE